MKRDTLEQLAILSILSARKNKVDELKQWSIEINTGDNTNLQKKLPKKIINTVSLMLRMIRFPLFVLTVIIILLHVFIL